MKLKNVNRYTRAGRNGKLITCPKCKESAPVFHFAWSALTCHQCNRSVEKLDWWVSSNPSKFSKRITLCNPKVKYYIDKNSIGEVTENGWRLDGKYSPNTINSHF